MTVKIRENRSAAIQGRRCVIRPNVYTVLKTFFPDREIARSWRLHDAAERFVFIAPVVYASHTPGILFPPWKLN